MFSFPSILYLSPTQYLSNFSDCIFVVVLKFLVGFFVLFSCVCVCDCEYVCVPPALLPCFFFFKRGFLGSSSGSPVCQPSKLSHLPGTTFVDSGC